MVVEGLNHYLGRGAHTATTRQPLVTSTQECQFSPAADFTQILASGRGCEGPPARTSAVSRDLDPRQAQDRGGGLYQICTRLNRPPPINWHPRKPELLARGGY